VAWCRGLTVAGGGGCLGAGGVTVAGGGAVSRWPAGRGRLSRWPAAAGA
jgi:hypothetical protein